MAKVTISGRITRKEDKEKLVPEYGTLVVTRMVVVTDPEDEYGLAVSSSPERVEGFEVGDSITFEAVPHAVKGIGDRPPWVSFSVARVL